MNQRRHLAIIAACATIMAAIPLTTLFQLWTWLLQSMVLVAMVCAVLIGSRALRAPVWVQPLAGLITLFFGVTWIYGNGHAYGGIIPNADTLRYFGSLAQSGGSDISKYAIPVPDVPGFLFLTASGVAVCAILVDLLAIGLRKPALAGLPMLAMYAVAVEIDSHNVSILTFAIAACGYLWLLVSDSIDRVRTFGRRFTGDGRGMDVWESSPLASTGRRITLIGVVCALFIPVLLPGIGSGFIHRSGVPGIGGSGSGSCVNICSGGVNMFAALKGQLNEAQTLNELTVRTDEALPQQYLRLGVAENLTPQGFGTTASNGGPLTQEQTNVRSKDAPKYNATVTINSLAIGLLPVYLDPITTSFRGVSGWGFDPTTETAFSSGTTSKGMQYEFSYQEQIPTAANLQASGQIPPTSQVMDLATVPQNLKLVDTVVTQQTQNTTNEYDAVRSLEDYLLPSNGFSYALSTKTGTSGSDIVDFLTNRQGFCIQYAATLAWLVRAAHYPARVAFGFLGGTKEPDGLSYVMTNHDLHAWTEVYFQGYGWVPFDPTPSVSNKILPGYDQPITQQSGAPQTGVTKPGAAGSGGAGAHVQPTKSDNSGLPVKSAHVASTPTWVYAVLAGVLLLILALASPAIARLLVRNRRAAVDRKVGGDAAAPGEPWVVVDDDTTRDAARRRVHAVWDEFMDTLVDFDVPVDLSESPAATCERVVRTTELTDGGRVGVRTIGRAEQFARYARQPGAIGPLDPELRRFRKELAGNVPFSMRVRAALLPPSVTVRWREAVTIRWARTIGSTTNARENVVRTLRLRSLASAPRRLLAGRSSK